MVAKLGYRTTALDVVQATNCNLTGTTALITGGNSGIVSMT
jgi:hypothetical protein